MGAAQETRQIAASSSWKPYGALALGIAATAMAAIFIRLAQNEGVSSLLIAASRLAIAAVILTPITLPRFVRHIRQLQRVELLLVAISGAFLALHFILWITSLGYTSVLIGVVLVMTGPLWSALLESVFLHVVVRRMVMIGLMLAVAGSVVISFPTSDSPVALGSNPLLGSAMALGGAAAFSVYMVIGRRLRPRLPLFPYIWLVYGSAALISVLVVLLTRTPITGHSAEGYLWLGAVALIPQLIGHSAFNYAIAYLSATYVGIAAQLEPLGSAILAMLLFREIPRPLQIAGSFIVLVGVTLASIGQNETK